MRNILFVLLVTLSCTKSLGAFLKDIEDLKTITTFTEAHTIAWVDAITKKGGGTFTWVADDKRDEAWGLIIKSDVQSAVGSWVRQNAVRLNPDWFGAINIKQVALFDSPSFKALGYDEKTILKRYFTYIPDITLDDTPDWAALQMMCKLQQSNWNAIELCPLDYYINRSVTLAEPKKGNYETDYLLEGNGAWIHSTNKNGFVFFRTMPDNQKESVDVFSSRRFDIRNLGIRGTAGSKSGSVGIAIGGTFHTIIENVHLTSLDTGIVLRHAMSSIITRCNALNIFSVCYYLGSGVGAWEGSTSTNSGSNQSQVLSCRQVSGINQYAGVVIYQSSECRVEDYTLDGGSKKHTAYAVYINSGLSNTVKDGYVKGIHAESMVDSALVKFRGGNGTLFHVSDLFVQYGCNVVELECVRGYAQVSCSNFTYLPSGCTFSSKGNGAAWHFDNVTEANKQIVWKEGAEYSLPIKSRLTNKSKF